MPLKYGHPSVSPPGSWTPATAEKVVNTAIVDGVTVNAEPLVDASTPYKVAVVRAQTPGANSQTKPTANAGTVYICYGAESIVAATPIAPGDAPIQLLPDCNLADYYLAVDVAGDGVTITYT